MKAVSFVGITPIGAVPTGAGFPSAGPAASRELSQLCPQVIAHALATRTDNDYFIEWGGGYYYPDLFGLERPDRWDLLARHARRTQSTDEEQRHCASIGFNVWRYDSPDALKAYEIVAREIGPAAGDPRVSVRPVRSWRRRRPSGSRTAGGSRSPSSPRGIRSGAMPTRGRAAAHRPRSPGKSARTSRRFRPIRRVTIGSSRTSGPTSATPRERTKTPRTWSQEDAAARNGIRGYTPVVWCAERLSQSVHVVGPEELLWRIRMQHAPDQTKRLIQEFR